MLSKQPLFFASIQTRLRRWPAVGKSRPAVSEDAGAFALRISTSGCGDRNAGTIVHECSESVRGVLSAAKLVVDSIECVKCGFLGDVCGRGSDRDFGPESVCRFVSRSLLGHGFGAFAGARRRLALLLRLHRPAGYGFRSKSVCEVQRRFLRSLRKCRASALGAGPLAGFAGCDPSRTREFNKTETKSCT